VFFLIPPTQLHRQNGLAIRRSHGWHHSVTTHRSKSGSLTTPSSDRSHVWEQPQTHRPVPAIGPKFMRQSFADSHHTQGLPGFHSPERKPTAEHRTAVVTQTTCLTPSAQQIGASRRILTSAPARNRNPMFLLPQRAETSGAPTASQGTPSPGSLARLDLAGPPSPVRRVSPPPGYTLLYQTLTKKANPHRTMEVMHRNGRCGRMGRGGRSPAGAQPPCGWRIGRFRLSDPFLRDGKSDPDLGR
jgi:hypothetical protein